ncbi:Thioredoxin-1 [compost metagenome]
MLEVTDQSFETEVLAAGQPVLVDFWAPWCGPCKLQAPVLEQLAATRAGELKVVKVNVDENPVMAGRLAVRGLPTLMLFKAGDVVARATGLQPLANLEELVDH